MNKTVLKAAGCVFAAMAILFLNYVLFHIYVNEKLDLKTTYVAARDIPPRSRIKEEDLVEVRMPTAYLLDGTYSRKNEIIGRYTEIQGMIPAGSLFYRRMLFDAEELPDTASQLRSGQTAYAMLTDRSMLGSIIPGQRADIHVSLKERTGQVITGCLIKGARVISITDHKGLSLDDPDSTGVPYMCEIAVSTADIRMLSVAEAAGDIRLFATDDSYDTALEAQLQTDTPLTDALEKLQGTVTEEPVKEEVPESTPEPEETAEPEETQT